MNGFVDNEEARVVIGLPDVDSTIFHLKKQPLQAMTLRQLLMNWVSSMPGWHKLLHGLDQLLKMKRGLVLF